MSSHAQFQVERLQGLPVIEVQGEIDIANAEDFEGLLAQTAAAGPSAVIVSLERATYFDSRGIQALLRFAERLSRSEQRLLVVSPNGTAPRRILDIAGVPQIIPMFDSTEEALRTAGIPELHPPRPRVF